MLHRYTGNTPSYPGRHAKYSVISGPEGDRVRLRYYVTATSYDLLTTSDHPDLCEMVNRVKTEINGQPRGPFYINEFHDVLVPDGEGGCYWAGHYEPLLEFAFETGIVGPVAPSGLEPGDLWKGPHVGIRHTLRSGAADIRYESKSGTRVDIVDLSRHVGAEAARTLAGRLARVMGGNGGRFYINEASEMFAPVGGGDDGLDPIYVGHLAEDQWFSPPSGFARP